MEPQGWLISQDLNTNDNIQSTGSVDKLITGGGEDNSKVDGPRMRSTPLRLALPSDDARGQYLSATRREMYDALALFHAHVKSVVSLMFGIMTAVMAVEGIALERNVSPKLLSVVLHGAPAILALIFPFSLVSIVSIGRYYRLYVAALVFAATLHDQEGISGHQWLDEIKKIRLTLGNGADESDIVRARVYRWPNGWVLCSLLIGFIGLVSVALAILLWMQL